MGYLTNVRYKSNDLANISTPDFYTGTIVSLEELAIRTIEREQNKFSSIEINHQENLQNFRELLLELIQDEYDNEFIAPTDFAYQSMEKFLRELSNSFNRILPIPNFIPDGEGGIRAEWNIQDREIRLVCPAKSDWKPYIYFEEGDFYDVEKDVKIGNLIKRFNWLLDL